MIETRIVRRYATALFNAAVRMNAVDRVESDLGLVSYALETIPALMDAVRSPIVPRDKKQAIIRDVFADKVHEVTLSFLELLVEKRREEVALQIEPEYIALADEARGVVKADVISAVELTPDEEARLVAKLSAMTGKSVSLSLKVDPAIIGGIIVEMEDRLIDGSVRGELEALRESLMS